MLAAVGAMKGMRVRRLAGADDGEVATAGPIAVDGAGNEKLALAQVKVDRTAPAAAVSCTPGSGTTGPIEAVWLSRPPAMPSGPSSVMASTVANQLGSPAFTNSEQKSGFRSGNPSPTWLALFTTLLSSR